MERVIPDNLFVVRSEEPEIMDDLACSGQVLNQTLLELDVINKWLGGNRVTINGVRKLLKIRPDKQAVSVADLGCGGGGMLKQLARLAKKEKRTFFLNGIDANPNVIAFAKTQLKDFPEAKLHVQDVLSNEFSQQKFDVIIATLFLHHFRFDQLVKIVRGLKEQSAIGFVINDIHRHWLAFYSIRWLTKLFSRSPMVKYDAPLSVLRAFSKQELIDVMKEAGIARYTIRWRWAFRWQVVGYV